MELVIKAENAEDLRYKIVSLAQQFDGKQIQTLKNKPTAAPVPTASYDTDSVPATEPVVPASIFTAPDITPEEKAAAAPKGKKAKAPPAEVDSDTTPNFTREQLADKLREVISKCGGNEARALMGQLGHGHIGKIPESGFADFMATADKTIAAKK